MKTTISKKIEKANDFLGKARAELFEALREIILKKKVRKHQFSMDVYVTDEENCERLLVKSLEVESEDRFILNFSDGSHIDVADIGTDDLYSVADFLYSDLCWK